MTAWAVTAGRAQKAASPLQRNAVEHPHGIPPHNTRPSTMSKLSSSACLSATRGRYEPSGGGERR
jgi:hypothetical protein